MDYYRAYTGFWLELAREPHQGLLSFPLRDSMVGVLPLIITEIITG